mmetsp:Transcript_2813/g.4579  ORF Transcript_2813/g.4579 Transcript_2813/m.4579 type:complete len:154 (+) Transcript_2813:45-506(+)
MGLRGLGVKGLVLLAFAFAVDAASKVDHHTVKMHSSFIKNRNEQDFSDWEKAFQMADHNKDGLVPVKDAVKIFKDHYNLVHHIPKEKGGRGPAAAIHFMDDGSEFEKMVEDMMKWSPEKEMTYKEFIDQLHIYVDIKHKERGSLYDMAGKIFE